MTPAERHVDRLERLGAVLADRVTGDEHTDRLEAFSLACGELGGLDAPVGAAILLADEVYETLAVKTI